MQYDILKPISRKSVYDALPKSDEASNEFEDFDWEFRSYSFQQTIRKTPLLDDYLEKHPKVLQRLIDKGFIGKVKKFVGFNLPIQTEKEFEILRDLLDGGIRNVTPDETATLWQRLIENLLPHGLT